jgi:hypothetical protein
VLVLDGTGKAGMKGSTIKTLTFIRLQIHPTPGIFLFLLAFAFHTRLPVSEFRHMHRAHIRMDSYLEAAATSSSLGLLASTDGRDEPPQPPLPADSPNAVQPPGHSRKSRKDKMRIELSADQPPTTQGHTRSRVYVACTQWCAPSSPSYNHLSSTFSSRVRKIRCDGAKPVCHHCCQRGGDEQCTYDSLPKRRGPDRVQGARTRGARPNEGDGEPPRRRRRRTATVGQETTPPEEAGNSYGIQRPLATGNPSALDILGDPVPDVRQQNAGAPTHPLKVSVFQSLGSGVRLSLTASHDLSFTRHPTRNRNPVSGSCFVVIAWCSRIFSHMTPET